MLANTPFQHGALGQHLRSGQPGWRFPFSTRGSRECDPTTGGSTTQPPQESLLQGVGEEALTDCRTSDSGGAVWFTPGTPPGLGGSWDSVRGAAGMWGTRVLL